MCDSGVRVDRLGSRLEFGSMLESNRIVYGINPSRSQNWIGSKIRIVVGSELARIF